MREIEVANAVRREAVQRDIILAHRTAYFCLIGYHKGLPPVTRFLETHDDKQQPRGEMLHHLQAFSAKHKIPIRHLAPETDQVH